MTDLWTEASVDLDTEETSRLLTGARAAAASTWPFLAAASTATDFDNRLGLVGDKLDAAVAKVVGDDPGAFISLRAKVAESFMEDFNVLLDERQREAQRRNDHRAFLRAEARKRARVIMESKRRGHRRLAWSIDQVKAVLQSKGAQEIDGTLLDINSANAIAKVFDGLSPENQQKMLAMDIGQAGKVAWKLVGGGKQEVARKQAVEVTDIDTRLSYADYSTACMKAGKKPLPSKDWTDAGSPAGPTGNEPPLVESARTVSSKRFFVVANEGEIVADYPSIDLATEDAAEMGDGHTVMSEDSWDATFAAKIAGEVPPQFQKKDDDTDDDKADDGGSSGSVPPEFKEQQDGTNGDSTADTDDDNKAEDGSSNDGSGENSGDKPAFLQDTDDEKKESALVDWSEGWMRGFNAGLDAARAGEPVTTMEHFASGAPTQYGQGFIEGMQAHHRLASFRKGAPFADYEDFADCVAKNSDKEDAEAYCGKIKHQTEDKTSKLFASKLVCRHGHTLEQGCQQCLSDDDWHLEDDKESAKQANVDNFGDKKAPPFGAKDDEDEPKTIAEALRQTARLIVAEGGGNPFGSGNPFIPDDPRPDPEVPDDLGMPNDMLDGPTMPETTRPRVKPSSNENAPKPPPMPTAPPATTHPDQPMVASREASSDFMQSQGGGVASALHALYQFLVGDGTIPSWFPERFLTDEEKQTRRWATTPGGSGYNPQFGFSAFRVTAKEQPCIGCGHWFQGTTCPKCGTENPPSEEDDPDWEKRQGKFRAKTADRPPLGGQYEYDFRLGAEDARAGRPMDPNAKSEAYRSGYNSAKTSSFTTSQLRVAAKVAEIADGVLQTNSGMDVSAAIDVAIKTVKRYPRLAGVTTPERMELLRERQKDRVGTDDMVDEADVVPDMRKALDNLLRGKWLT